MTTIPLSQLLKEIDQHAKDGLITPKEARIKKAKAIAAAKAKNSEVGLMP